MVATNESKDEFGVTHHFCDHHTSPESGHSHEHSHQDHEFDKHAGHSVNMFRDRFWLSLVLTLPVMAYSDLPKTLFGISFPAFPGSEFIPLVISTVVFFYGGLVFIKGAWAELAHRLPGMMTLISLAISVAYGYSVISQLFLGGETLFWELTSLITIMLLGHWIEMRSVSSAQGALQELSKLLPDNAEVVRGSEVIKIPVSELKIGDILLVRPGAKLPADGKVTEGTSTVNESMITGESKPIEKAVNSEVIAGTVNASGSLKVRVEKIGESTALAGIVRLVAEAQASKSRMQVLADRAAFYLTIAAITSGTVTLITWLVLGRGVAFSIDRAVAVLVIACPHALGLAIPLVTSISTSLSARSGLLVRERRALEAARNIDVVLFDKTGTLTSGEFGVSDVFPQDQSDEILKLAASVEAESEHALGAAIVEEAKKRKLVLPKVSNFRATAGKAVSGLVSGHTISIGRPEYFEKKSDSLEKSINDLVSQGKTVVLVARGQEVIGTIAVADQVRAESKEAVKALKDLGVRIALVTGDNEAVAAGVSKQLGIEEYFAGVLPENKSQKVRELQKDGSKVAIVGDGVNDAPALTAADLGIAIGAGTDVAIESAGIILVKNDPRDVVKIIDLSKATYSKMIQNLLWAAGYNVVAIPLAAGVLAAQNIILPPAFGAILMSASTVIVAANAQLLRKIRLA